MFIKPIFLSEVSKLMFTYTGYADEELVSLLKNNDEHAFTELYNRYWDKLFAIAYNRLNDEFEAEEAVQTIFLSLWKRRNKMELTNTIATYLSVAVKYQMITRLSVSYRNKSRAGYLSTAMEEAKETTSDWFAERELKRQIEAGIRKLPEKCRIVFLMSREEDKGNAQIAKELNISEKTVEGHMTNALRLLRSSLKASVPILMATYDKVLHHFL